ncbi:MAG: glutamine-hydrolyzing GMP synthase [Proteobacteria bacterium]|nr:glutamine-hydrolyzing GMP synthase [Pseudomonadota bacterium]
MLVRFHFLGVLDDFLPRPQRGCPRDVELVTTVTLKHAIEALGVPHTEIGMVRVNGKPAGLEDRLEEGAEVRVHPVDASAMPPGELRFIADAHLGALAHRLRMAGFDTLFRNDYADPEIAAIAKHEQRIVLTRDRALLMHKAIARGCYVRALKPDAQFRELAARLPLAPACRPFSRCLECNAPLLPVPKADVLAHLPESVRLKHERFTRCEGCGRVFWEGSHWRRMRGLLSAVLDCAGGSVQAGRPGASDAIIRDYSFSSNGTAVHKKILILDFGSQVTQLIARRVREQQVYCEIHPYDVSDDFIRNFAPQGIILSGGPNSVYEATEWKAPQAVFEIGVPVFGICYGMQTMASQLGGKVESSGKREFGYAEIRARGHSELFRGIQDRTNDEGHGLLDVWMSHGDKVTELPPGFKVIASNESTPLAAMADEVRKFYAVQFHPEVTHTIKGKDMIARFVHEICGCEHDWNMPDYVNEAIEKVRAQVGSDEVILGLSGGVDSSVVAALLHRAIGDQLTCVFVDNGLLRLNEGEMVMQMFARNLGVKVIHVDATEQFMGHLKGVSDPEAKRKIIGREFVEVFQAEAAKLPSAKWLAQGTIYPDVIESAGAKTGKAHAIKSHHNVGGLPETLNLKLLEPLRELFKDEVRELGIALGLPHEMVYRHPFPGPGLGVRILGEVKKDYADLLRRADAIFIDELRAADWYDKTSQAFAVFLPVKSVGVMGDGRTYEYVVALRAVQTQDFMTAHWAELPHSLLGKVSNRIINEVRGINRVVYDISGKPPATIEWE